MKKTFTYKPLLTLLLAPLSCMGGMGAGYVYQARPYTNIPRFERDWLTTFKGFVMGGWANNGYNGSGDKTNVINLYGANKIAQLGSGEIGNPASTLYDADLAALLASGIGATGAGTLAYNGEFKYVEADFYVAQNFKHGIFVDMNIPVKQLKINDVTSTDTSTGPDAEAIEWITVRNTLTSILAHYDLAASNWKKTGIGDMTLNLGWTYNNDNLSSLNYFDTTIRVGVSIPTAAKRNEDEAFAIAIGRDGHVGIPVSFDFGIGAFDWLTWGAHVGAEFFIKKTKEIRMQTSTAQNGYIKLLKGNAKRDMGHIFDAGTYVQANVFRGLFFMFGYLYTHQASTHLTPENTVRFPTTAANADTMYKSWRMHSIHTELTYDFVKEGKVTNPVISVFYTRPVAGKRSFQTNTFGGTVGVNLAWDF